MAWWRLLHLGALALVAAQALAGRACVLTLWQDALLGKRGGATPLIMRWVDAVMVPVGNWVKPRLANLSEADWSREPSNSGSPFARNVSNWVGRDLVYPTNVLHFATECGFVGHPAAFPEELPEFFIKLFSREGDVVCDPFMGSGTTGVVCRFCRRSNRRFIGIDILETNVRLAGRRIEDSTRGIAAAD